MKFWVGITDLNWFNFLSNESPDEVNFWRPGGMGFSAIGIGAPFLFKLKKPHNKIVGGGYFVKSEKLPLSLAWDAFENKNGASSIEEFRTLVNSHRMPKEMNPQIGCIILNQPFFLSEDKWVDTPEDWPYHSPGKVYDTESFEGKNIWEAISLNLKYSELKKMDGVVSEPTIYYGKEYLIKGRIGQGAFRVLVTSAYNKRCAVTGEKTLPVLEAAHIKSYKEHGPNRTDNGMLLRSDVHKLFDNGYITVTKDYKIEISRKIKEEFDNGKNYYVFHGKSLAVFPKDKRDYPSSEFIEWHNNKFLG